MAPGERIGLGVIGFGPRCTYDIKPILTFPDVRAWPSPTCRPAGGTRARSWSTRQYGNADCKTLPRLPRAARPQGHRRRADRHRRPLACTGRDAGREGRQGRLQREAVRHHHRRLPGTGRDIAPAGRVFQAGTQRRSVPNFQQAVELAHSGKLGKIHTLYASVYTPSLETTWLPGEPTPRKRRGRLEPVAGPGTVAALQQAVRRRATGAASGTSTPGARLLDWGAHTVDLCQWANKRRRHHAHRVRTVVDTTSRPAMPTA